MKEIPYVISDGNNSIFLTNKAPCWPDEGVKYYAVCMRNNGSFKRGEIYEIHFNTIKTRDCRVYKIPLVTVPLKNPVIVCITGLEDYFMYAYIRDCNITADKIKDLLSGESALDIINKLYEKRKGE